MSAQSESATNPAPCACTNISLMQLFHELKQKFPGVPDHVVSSTIELYCHDKHACETHLHSEAKASLTHAYHATSSAAARQLNELKVQGPLKCPNQPIVKHEAHSPTTVTAVACQSPQTATVTLSTSQEEIEDHKPLVNTDANQNVVEEEKDLKVNENNNNVASPVTIINIDNCIEKCTAESPTDNNVNVADRNEKHQEVREPLQQGSLNYKILKSNKIRSCLNEKLEKTREKKTIKKEEPTLAPLQCKEQEKSPSPQPHNVEKPKRPNTLEFLKPSPGIAFKEPPEARADPRKAISPAPPLKSEAKETTPGGSYWPSNYPLNLSVNVNCHMDYARPYDPWLEDYESPRAVTSVNLTVCTPTSNMASPVRETRDDDGGFEGHVTVTVSPSTARAPRRRAPPPPQPQPQPQPQPRPHQITSPEMSRCARPTVESSQERTLIERQKERLGRLATALAQERGRVSQLKRERDILRAPPSSPAATHALREHVHRLREQCDKLAKRLEMGGNEPEAAEFYRNIYTGQRASARRPARPAPPPPDDTWECGVCTFRNHGLLDKCEACEMPHIVIGTSPVRTLDSGFGSFRDRDRKVSQVDGATFAPNVNERPATVAFET